MNPSEAICACEDPTFCPHGGRNDQVPQHLPGCNDAQGCDWGCPMIEPIRVPPSELAAAEAKRKIGPCDVTAVAGPVKVRPA